MTSQDDDVFSPPRTQSTQPTQATQSFRQSIHEEEERRDTGDSFVSAKEAFGSRNPSRENMHQNNDAALDGDDERADLSRSDAQDTVVHHELGPSSEIDADIHDLPEFPQPPGAISEQYSTSVETKIFSAPEQSTTPPGLSPVSPDADAHDETMVHHDIDDQMDIDDDVRSPSDGSSPSSPSSPVSPVKPLVRKSSLTFASLPAREPLLAKKSMGNRVSRTSHIDPSKSRNSYVGRFTGGKSLGGSQFTQSVDVDMGMDMDMDAEMERPVLSREESETTKIHNKTSTQRLFERINMLKQQNEASKPVSQNILSSQPSQTQSFASTQPKEEILHSQASQLAYPTLNVAQENDDDEEDWISPVRPAAVAPKVSRPALTKSYTVDLPSSPGKQMPAKLVSVSNPDLSNCVESTTPVGSPTGKRYMDGPLSASKSKLYSAFRAAKEKLIGSSATSAQAKLDALNDSPRRPMFHTQSSSDDMFSSPKRSEKGTSIFSHARSPSKESIKSGKSGRFPAMPGSPGKDAGRRTRSSSEREKQKEKETRDKEARDAKESKQQQRAEERLREMREKEQSKATAQQKAKLATRTPTAMSSQSSLRQPGIASTTAKTPVTVHQSQQPLSRPGTARTDLKDQDMDSADEMPPPPPPKSLLPTTKPNKAALREPRKLLKPTSKEALSKAKAPQKIMVNLNSSRYGQAPPPAARPAPAPAAKPLPPAPQAVTKPTAPAPKLVSASSARPASALSTKSGPLKTSQNAPKTAAPRIVRPQPQAQEKLKAPAAQPRADLGAARPVSRMQTVQDASRINVPPVNPAKPPKRAFQGENDETLHRPAKRPSQLAKMNPITPAHAQFAKGKIPFAEPAHAPQPQPPQIHYPNGEDIKLPEIMTDSEDEDSDNDFEQPSWVNTPNLREMLSSQQLMDPETIFGPIAPLEMEKVFPNKERHKRFRERTSSAYWANDQVTEEERRKEREARERLVRDGAWTYHPSPRPTPNPSR